VTLPAFAAERRAAGAVSSTADARLSIDVSCPQGAQQQTRRRLLLLSSGLTDGRSTVS